MSAFLLAHGADANALESGPPVLTGAVLAGRAEVVKLLLSSGARVDTRDVEGRTLLHVAARYGYDRIAGLLLAAHAEVDPVDGAGRTPLDDAVLYAQSAVVPVLLDYGADPRRMHPQDGRGPLHEACIKGSASLIEMLVNAGADPAARDKSGQTPIDLALAYKNRGAIAALEHLALDRRDCRETVDLAMQSATLRGRSELARLLIEGGFDINQPSPGGGTYLHQAALRGQKKIVQLFLERGAQVNALDETGGTPLHDAALAGNTDVILLLLDHGASIDAADGESGATPLMLAASVSRTEAVALLLARGANPALRDHAGHTALDRARETDDTQTVKLLEAAPKAAV
jgi:ankyrin repeat protein